MLAVEQSVSEAWRAHDGKKLAELTAENISFINIFGNYLATKADALKDWTSAGCDVKSVSVTQAAHDALADERYFDVYGYCRWNLLRARGQFCYLGHVGLR